MTIPSAASQLPELSSSLLEKFTNSRGLQTPTAWITRYILTPGSLQRPWPYTWIALQSPNAIHTIP